MNNKGNTAVVIIIIFTNNDNHHHHQVFLKFHQSLPTFVKSAGVLWCPHPSLCNQLVPTFESFSECPALPKPPLPAIRRSRYTLEANDGQ